MIEEHDSAEDGGLFKLDTDKIKKLGTAPAQHERKLKMSHETELKPWLHVDNPHIWEAF